eukprot:9012650-Alexandrium_andersonii.AAC.1
MRSSFRAEREHGHREPPRHLAGEDGDRGPDVLVRVAGVQPGVAEHQHSKRGAGACLDTVQ